jgi:hypothetical protein
MEIANEIYAEILSGFDLTQKTAEDLDIIIATAKNLVSDNDYAREQLREWKLMIHINVSGKLKIPVSTPEQSIAYGAIVDAIEKWQK